MTPARLLAASAIAACALFACAPDDDDVADDSASTSNAISGRITVGAKLATTTRVNLREEPTTASDVLMVLPSGAEVEALAAAPSGSFYNVRHGDLEGWVHGNYLRATGGSGAAQPADDGDFDGRRFSGVTLLWQGNWSFLVQCDSYSRSRGRVVFFCDESPSRSFVDEGNWIAVPRAYFSRSLCGQQARVCKGSRCVTAKIVEKSETGSKWEGSSAVLRALGVDFGFRGCSSSFGTATGVTVTFR